MAIAADAQDRYWFIAIARPFSSAARYGWARHRVAMLHALGLANNPEFQIVFEGRDYFFFPFIRSLCGSFNRARVAMSISFHGYMRKASRASRMSSIMFEKREPWQEAFSRTWPSREFRQAFAAKFRERDHGGPNSASSWAAPPRITGRPHQPIRVATADHHHHRAWRPALPRDADLTG
jgi:hypothetical protein